MGEGFTPYESLVFAVFCAAQQCDNEDVFSWLTEDFRQWNTGPHDALPFAPLAWMIRVALSPEEGKINP